MICDDAHVCVSLPLGEVVQADKAAGAHLGVDLAHQAQCPDAGRGADLDVLHGQSLGSPAGCLPQCLVTDPLLYIIGVATVGMRHLQRLGENLLLAILIRTYHMAGFQ